MHVLVIRGPVWLGGKAQVHTLERLEGEVDPDEVQD